MKEMYNLKIDDLARFLQEFQKESDRGAAILATAMLDQKLKTILETFLTKCCSTKLLLEGYNAPIGTLSARQNLAYSLGLITENEYKVCEIVRKIRNDFAHKFELYFSFKNPKVSKLCFSIDVSIPGQKDDFKDNPRALFINGVVLFSTSLLWREHYVKKHPIQKHDWGNTI